MAKPSWVKVSKTSGTGNSSVAISADAHTGRTSRAGTVTIRSTKNSVKSVNVSISQIAHSQFTTIENATPATIPAAGGIITFTGVSNVKTFEIGDVVNTSTGDSSGLSSATIKINSNPAVAAILGAGTLRYTLPGIEGESAQYRFTINITVGPNLSTLDRSFVISEDDFGITIKQYGRGK